MSFEHVVKPVIGTEMFSQADDSALLSQAAYLLILGSQFQNDKKGMQFRAEAGREGKESTFLPTEDLEAFPVPRLTSETAGVSRQLRLDSLANRYGRWFAEKEISGFGMRILPEMMADLAQTAQKNPVVDNALHLVETALRSPSEIVSVAAAAAYVDVNRDREVISILENGTLSKEELVRDVAATALARVDAGNSHITRLTTKLHAASAGADAHTSMLVHGTWARTGTWWQPGGDFHSYIIGDVWHDLYAQNDRFEWTGLYSDPARADGAIELRKWVQQHNEDGLSLMTHSHGGSVAMLANQAGLEIGKLVLLSCPVHTDKYMPNFAKIRVKPVCSIRVHMDLVILADRGGQRFRDPQIAEHVLPIWFDHSKSHNPDVWKKHGVKNMLPS